MNVVLIILIPGFEGLEDIFSPIKFSGSIFMMSSQALINRIGDDGFYNFLFLKEHSCKGVKILDDFFFVSNECIYSRMKKEGPRVVLFKMSWRNLMTI